jgi:hypothetical protein
MAETARGQGEHLLDKVVAVHGSGALLLKLPAHHGERGQLQEVPQGCGHDPAGLTSCPPKCERQLRVPACP